ncbi:MAG: transporter substrate-binding domain-containing protein [Deltaproteobacteria bacterium]|nr:transporter substrate-binding domain-containing protein [Deltaproteobacteria bacterium]
MEKYQRLLLHTCIWFLLFCLPISTFAADKVRLHLTPEEQAWLADHRKIVVGGEKDWAPFDFVDENGKYIGVANDYLKIIGEKLGIEVEIITGPSWNELLSMIRRNEIDVLPAICHSKEREAFVHFTDPYFKLTEFIFARTDDYTVSKFADLEDKTIVVVSGACQGTYEKPYGVKRP